MAVVEPEAKPRRKGREQARGTQCLNCGLATDTNYCPNCGQHNTSHNHGLGQFLHEFMDEFLHLDSKILRTLVPLFTKPGFLTQEWVAGKRVRYITPLKLYVTLSAFCFLAISLKGTLYGEPKSNFNITFDPPAKSQKSAKSQKDFPEAENAMDNLFKRKIGKLDREHISQVKEKFFSRLPTTAFLLMPVVAGMFSLLYFRARRYYVEHLVFTLHYYSFIFGVVSVSSLIPPIPVLSVILRLGAILWALAYLPMALVRNYRQGYFKTFVKLGIFGVAYMFVLGFAILGTLLITAYTMPDLPEASGVNAPAVNAPAP